MTDMPSFNELTEICFQALKQLGGSGTLQEINEKAYEIGNYSDEQLENVDKSNRPIIAFELAWMRTNLRITGYIENISHGVWALTPKGKNTESVNGTEVTREVNKITAQARAQSAQKGRNARSEPHIAIADESDEQEEESWQDVLLTHLQQQLTPQGFEHLCQRILREKGFEQVEVTRTTGDGGIDGVGILKVSLLSFHVIFQCKRYQGAVGPEKIREFRGAMAGRTDKGLFITTGHFTRAAREEATRGHVSPIELIDGEALCELLKELQLGVSVRTEEKVIIEKQWLIDHFG